MIFHKSVGALASVFFINFCIADRRIRNGIQLTKEEDAKSYMVYLAKASASDKLYDNWICGGALVTPEYIVTSAACVDDVKYMYAIAGSLTAQSNVDTNECKKRVILTCIPKEYNLDYAKVERWAYIDIAVVKVESSRTPEYCWGDPIEINYEPKFQEPGIDTVTFGYGSLDKWRKEDDTTDNNAKTLHYAPLLILNKKICQEYYKKDENLYDIIEKYMICTINGGQLDHKGEVLKPSAKVEGCVYPKVLRGQYCVYPDNYRRNLRQNLNHSIDTSICQNDHGGPLVTWVGSKRMLIGVASVFRINDNWQCEGPNLFTSTQCSGKFLDCILNPSSTRSDTNITRPFRDQSKRRYLDDCDNPSAIGFNIVRKHISWADHPDGPAADELPVVHKRPQIPLSQFVQNQ